MKRLANLELIAAEQLRELEGLFRKNAIYFETTTPSFLDGGALWVADHDFNKAREIFTTESAVYARRTQAQWEREWSSKYNRSWFSWVRFQVARRPVEFITIMTALALMLIVFAVYPALVGLRLGGLL